MTAEVTSRGKQLRELCQRFGVDRLDAFGSATRSDFDARSSDIDLVVHFGRAPSGMDGAQQYFGLLRSLESLFGRSVDLLEESALRNRFMIQEIARTRVPLYHAA